MTLRLDLAYDGAPFRGYARQPELRTVQGDLEDALERVLQRPVVTEVAGRTDAGVHALGQVVSLTHEPEGLILGDLRASLNKLCGPSISIARVERAEEGFSARFSARSRTYVYAVLIGDAPHPFLDATTWRVREDLDPDLMNEAAGHLVGERDFSAFGRTLPPDASGVRNLYELSCRRDGSLVRIKARASSFLQQMVRSLAGTLVEVGAGKKDPAAMPEIAGGRDRGAAGRVAPPHGLCLVSVEYDEGWSRPV